MISHVSVYSKRQASAHLRTCPKRPVPCPLGCGGDRKATHSVPHDHLEAHIHEQWMQASQRVERQVKRMILTAAAAGDNAAAAGSLRR